MNQYKENSFHSTLQFEKDFISFINVNKRKLKEESLISYAFPVNTFDIISKLNSINEKYNDFLFFKKAIGNFTFIAINRLIDFSYNRVDLLQLESFITITKSSVINNWSDYNLENIPFITGSAKFNSDKSSEEWDDFNPIHFFIPQLILLKNKKQTFLVYNSKLNCDFNEGKILDDFLESVFPLLDLKDELDVVSQQFVNKIPSTGKDKIDWKNLVENVIQQLDSEFKKIVVSRRIDLKFEDKIDWNHCFLRLESEYSDCYLFMYKSNSSIFFGASPEKFIGIQNKTVEIDALAGSAPNNRSNIETELLNTKNIKEHQCVINFIEDAIAEFATKITSDKNPQIKELSNVHHLYTKIRAKLNSKTDTFRLLESLYPTPAVCGLPKLKAMNAINEIESFDRGLYSGLIGWFDLSLNCEFAVAIRSALYKNGKLYLYAGAGIVKESDPEEEYSETELKFKTILNLFYEQSTG